MEGRRISGLVRPRGPKETRPSKRKAQELKEVKGTGEASAKKLWARGAC